MDLTLHQALLRGGFNFSIEIKKLTGVVLGAEKDGKKLVFDSGNRVSIEK
ncbi:hypothetical protein N9D23_00105 [Rubripirellula sp.]|nr:hypothetical protein [Rubripirellula sp.]